jgi:hypothetical protein
MDMAQTLALLAIGGLLGAAGQALRVIIGIKKQIDDARAASPPKTAADWFDGKKLGISFILGAVAGLLAAVSQYSADLTITRELLMGFAAAGYAGADFIGGLMPRWLPGR